MVFPYDVWGVYKAPERDVGEASGQKLRASVIATVTRDTIKFVATPKAEFGVAEVYSKNQNFPSYMTLTKEEKEKGTIQTAQSAIDGDKNYRGWQRTHTNNIHG